MIYELSLAGAIHGTLALSGIALGLTQLLRRKGGAVHRALGYAYVYGMLIADAAALLIFRSTGHFNILHVFATINMACIVAAIIPVLRTPRPPNWKYLHYYFISWSYVGLLAGAATQLVLRTVPLASLQQTWTMTMTPIVAVILIGFVLIRHHRPVPGVQSVPNSSMIQSSDKGALGIVAASDGETR